MLGEHLTIKLCLVYFEYNFTDNIEFESSRFIDLSKDIYICKNLRQRI